MERLQAIRITGSIELKTVTQVAGHDYLVRNRSHYGLSFCRDGQITYTMNGREFISDPNHAVLHPMGADYRLQVQRTGQFPLINFTCTGLEGCGFMVIPLKNPEVYLRQFEKMQQLVLFRRDQLQLLSEFYDMLGRLCREGAQGEEPLQGILSYLETNLADPSLSNSRLAAQAGFSEVYFRRLFARSYGMPPRQYILELRLRKARQLLEDGRHSVTAVSELCGFSSVYHFSRCFAKRTGLSPTDYASQSRLQKI